MNESEGNFNTSSELNVSFGCQCNDYQDCNFILNDEPGIASTTQFERSKIKSRNNSSFSCLCAAALSANFTLANTNLCNDFLGGQILENLDSPKSFRTLRSSPSMSRFGLLSRASDGNISTTASSTSTDIDVIDDNRKPIYPFKMKSSIFLNAGGIKMASGAAGEDRVQAVCSEENEWLFCGIYDGFNGRDAADFLAVVLYEKVVHYLYQLELNIKKQDAFNCSCQCSFKNKTNSAATKGELSVAFRSGLLDFLARSLAEVENDFMAIVEKTMGERPDIVSIGSCVLTVLLHEGNLYVLNLGDSRAVLASWDINGSASLKAIQLTEIHTVDNASERMKVVANHPDDPSAIFGGRVKGKLKLTRAFGAGYLKKRILNDALMGILKVRNLQSPPYVYTHPFCMCHSVSDNDLFVILGSDGLFDFFKNDEVVEIVHQFMQCNPCGDPAKHLIEKLLVKVAEKAGFRTEELMRIPAGSRRKYHDDTSVIVIIFGYKQRIAKALTGL